MKFVIATQDLINLVSKCLNVVSAKPVAPILTNLLIEAAHDELSITSTDLTVGIRCFTNAKILAEGSTTLPAKKLSNLLRELTSTNLEVSTSSNEITEILSDSSRFKLHGMSHDEFPALPEFKEAFHFKTEQAKLKEMFYRTSFAVSREDNRYTLTGVNLSIENSVATFAGTDGKRLAKIQLHLDIDPAFKGNYIIPLKAVDEIQKNLTDEGTATVYLMKDKIAVEANQTTIVTKLLSGEYPDIERIIPQNIETSVALHRDELITLLRQVALFTVDSTHSVRFTFTEGSLHLSANAAEVGEGKVSMPANYRGDKLEVAFNPTFFLDILRHSHSESINLGLMDAYNPGRITENDSNAVFVLMPMRLNED